MKMLNSFDDPEAVADMLTYEEIQDSLAYNRARGAVEKVAVLEDELRRRQEDRRTFGPHEGHGTPWFGYADERT
jgi:hypothetical protein